MSVSQYRILELLAENDRLRAELQSMTDDRDSWEKQASDRTDDALRFAHECDEARAEVEALRADAEHKRGLLLLALYHSQGGSSPVGQSIRRHLGIGRHDHLTPDQINDAARAAQGDKT